MSFYIQDNLTINGGLNVQGNLFTQVGTVYTQGTIIDDRDLNMTINGELFLKNVDVGKLLTKLEDENKELKNEINKIKRILEQLYYAPGGPGYLEAQENFDKKRKLE